MQKITLFLLLIGCGNFIDAQSIAHYSLIMHVTHDARDYSKAQWQKSVSSISTLAKNCNENSNDTSAQAFSANQKEAIKTIKDVFLLCQNADGLYFEINIFNELVTPPSNGLVIGLRYSIEESTSLENKNKIDMLMTTLHNTNDKETLINNLNNLDWAFNLLSGQASLDVHCDDFIEATPE